MRFSTSSFFHHLNQPRLLTNGLKYFRIWFRFCRDIRILVSKKLTPRSIILRRGSEKYEYLSENKTKFETILTHWSVAQAGSNDEKN